MAAISVNETDKHLFTRRLETQAIVNQTANSAVIQKAVRVPDSAVGVTFYLLVDAMGGTTPLLDFSVSVPDFFDPAAIDDTPLAPLADWNGITQLTAAGPHITTVQFGPGVTGIADDDTGSATDDSTYSINCNLPPVIVYTITTDGTTDDEDYTFRLIAAFRR